MHQQLSDAWQEPVSSNGIGQGLALDMEMEVVNEDPLSSGQKLSPHIRPAPTRFGPPLSNDTASLPKHPAILPKADRVSLALVHAWESSGQDQASKAVFTR